MKNQSLLVASMRREFLQLGVRQVGLQLVLQDRLAFRRGKLGKKASVSPLGRIFPGFFLTQEKNAAPSARRNGDRTCLSDAGRIAQHPGRKLQMSACWPGSNCS